MAAITLGRIGFVPKGAYAAATEYVKYDLVDYAGDVYVA